MLHGSALLLSFQMYSNLAPRLGQTTFAAYSIGSTELRGGKINWGSLGSSISNAFKNTGRYLGSAAKSFVNSQAFKDIQQGINDSGLIRNVAGLAGDTLNSLVDIGRLKVENELQNLRNKAINSIPADQLAQILFNYQQSHDRITPSSRSGEATSREMREESRKRPYIEEVGEDELQAATDVSNIPTVSDLAVVPAVSVPVKRIRGAGEPEWQQQLNSMLGQGVNYRSSNQCI